MSKLFHILLPAIILLMAGCVSMADKAIPPEVSVTGLRLSDQSGLLQQKFALDLKIVNPNNFGYTIKGLAFTLYVNDEKFATGIGDEVVRIPKLGENVMTVEITTGLFRLIRQVRNLGRDKILTYRIVGEAHIRGLRRPLPYEKTGEIAF